jgi:hypothetical protein
LCIFHPIFLSNPTLSVNLQADNELTGQFQ